MMNRRLYHAFRDHIGKFISYKKIFEILVLSDNTAILFDIFRELKKYNQNKKLIDLFSKHPEVRSVIDDILKGLSFREALIKNISINDHTP